MPTTYGGLEVGLTAVEVPLDDVLPEHALIIKAALANTGEIYVGLDEDVTTVIGFLLQAGEEFTIPRSSMEISPGTLGYLPHCIASDAAQNIHYWSY
jgi:hypothetical protein